MVFNTFCAEAQFTWLASGGFTVLQQSQASSGQYDDFLKTSGGVWSFRVLQSLPLQ